LIRCGYLYNIFLPSDNGQQDIAVYVIGVNSSNIFMMQPG